MRSQLVKVTLPGNLRYQPKSLKEIFGYDNLYVPLGEVEVAALEVLGEIGVIPPHDIALLTESVIQNILDIPTSEVDEVEREVTKHDVRAWVRIAQDILPPPLRRWVHVPLTSYDALDTARTLQFARAHREVLHPAIKQVLREFSGLTRKFADQIQIGRTHGQHALPITVGFWFATILNRFLYNAQMMDIAAGHLVGKISGAVGACNAQVGLGIADRCGDTSFERRVLAKLGLKAAPISTQILPPEPLAYFLHSCVMLSAAFGQFGDDARNLMRSEIAELAESFAEGQVGSSTMAHKRNPITFENLKGMWLRTKNEFGKVHDTLISDHQRDLTGSSVFRDFPIIVVNLTVQLETLLKGDKQGRSFLSRISIDAEACRRNFEKNDHLILAEPIYIALQMAGYEGDAHEVVNRQAVPKAQSAGIPLIAALEQIALKDPEVRRAMDNIPPDLMELLHAPDRYTGNAAQKALAIATAAEVYASIS